MIRIWSNNVILLKQTLGYRNCMLVHWDYWDDWDEYWRALQAGIFGPLHTKRY